MSTVRAPERIEPARRDGRPAPVAAPPGQAAERHLRVVGRSRRRPAARRAVISLSVVLGFVALLLAVASHVILLQGQQHLDRLTDRNKAAQDRYNALRLEVDRLQSPDRIVAEARRQGMEEPQNPIWLTPSTPAQGDGAAAPGPTPGSDQAEVKPYLGTTR